ncbi:MAG: protein kinase [Planctomycetes bacterium]|nr:protein kinase [Planctomycetota bacterium]
MAEVPAPNGQRPALPVCPSCGNTLPSLPLDGSPPSSVTMVFPPSGPTEGRGGTLVAGPDPASGALSPSSAGDPTILVPGRAASPSPSPSRPGAEARCPSSDSPRSILPIRTDPAGRPLPLPTSSSETDITLIDSARCPSPGDGPRPRPTESAAGNEEPPGEPFGRYRLQRVVGRGGMGLVHKAWDVDLKRTVAVKMLLAERAASDEAVERFHREARSAARLRHPGIVQVHDVGTIDGRHYFTMDFIEGESLDAARTRLQVRRFLEILRDVAFALHYAHEAGVVHRDVKPANILLDAQGRPYVTDFGLAKQVDQASKGEVTVSGTVMGTVHYMSPEQAGGEQDLIGGYSDVWSLGVMLYDYLAGRKPFEGESYLNILYSIMHQEPMPPSRAAVHTSGGRRFHRDLETICLKSLEKEIPRRYAAAAAFGEDLRRFLDGEPIEARPPTFAYRAERWTSRNRGAVAAIVALLGVGGLAAHYAWRAHVERALRERSILESALLQEVKAPLAEALGTRRGGDVRLLARVAAEAGGRADALLARDPGLAEAHYVKGWLARLTGRLGEAESELDRALAARPADAAARYQRGLVQVARYRDLLSSARRRWYDAQRADVTSAAAAVAGSASAPAGTPVGAPASARPHQPTLGELEAVEGGLARRRERAREDFEEVARLTAEPARPMPAKGLAPCGQGLLALCRGEESEAERLLAGALEADPYLDEAQMGVAEVVRSRVLNRRATPADLVACFDRALDVNKGLEEVWRGSAEARAWQAEVLFRTGRTADALRAWAEADVHARRAIALAPDLADPLVVRASLLAAWANARMSGGEDARAVLEEALALSTEAVRRAPGSAEANGRRAWAELRLAEARVARGEAGVKEGEEGDVEQGFRRAIAAFGEALALAPEDATLYRNRGDAWRALGTVEAAVGRDSREALRNAVADLEEAVRRSPASAAALTSRANARVALASAEFRRGVDAKGGMERAIADYGDALRLDAERVGAWSGRAAARVALALRIDPEAADARPLYVAALADADEALRLNPEYAHARLTRANALVCLGSVHVRRGGDWAAAYRKAIADCDLLLGRNPDSIDAWIQKARAEVAEGDALAARREDPREWLRRGIADLGTVLVKRPGLLDAFAARGWAYYALGKAESLRGEDPRSSYRSSIADLDEVLRRSPDYLQGYIQRGDAGRNLGVAEDARGGEPGPWFEKSLADYQSALARGRPATSFEIGRLLRCMRRYEEAVAAFQQAGKALPGQVMQAQAEIALTRQMRAKAERRAKEREGGEGDEGEAGEAGEEK